MPTFEIEQYEVYVLRYRIKADSEVDAIARLFQGDGDPIDGSLTFVNIADEYGMGLGEDPDLASQLFDRGAIASGDSIIPSIRSVRQVEQYKCCQCEQETRIMTLIDRMAYWTGRWVTAIKWKLGLRRTTDIPQGQCEDGEGIPLADIEELPPLELEEK